ncbi:MAG: PDZ domain-containing protein [Planctomyces sp.]|nr:PDZ domain-containing protein [Planctomyces sp.]
MLSRRLPGVLAALCSLLAAGLPALAFEDAPPEVRADFDTSPSSPTARYALEQAGRELSRIAAQVSPAVVHIQSDRGTTEETGSGVLMRNPADKTLIAVTNRHVVTKAARQKIDIRLSDGRVVHPRAVLEDPYTDLAVLLLDCDHTHVADWGDSDRLDIGHFVLAVGSPFGLRQSVTLGIISAKSRRALQLGLGEEDILNQDFLQTDAAINPGNSGGPLIDLQGHVVGINTAIASQGGGNEGIGFSIPSKLVRFVVEELLRNGEVKRGYLGVRLDDNFTDAAARRYRLDRRRGARVVEVYGNSPADVAGVTVDDIILAIDGEDVEDENHLINRVSLMRVNSTVAIEVLRAGRRVTLNVTLKERPPKRKQSRFDPNPKVEILPAGLELASVTDSLAVQAGQAAGVRGLLVMQCRGDEPNDLRLYDVIVEAARTPTPTVAELERTLRERSPGEAVLLKVLRAEQGRTIERLVTLTRPADDAPDGTE